MADKSTAEPQAQATTSTGEPVVVNVTLTQPTNQPALPTPGLDELPDGPRYNVDGQWVDANGNRLKGQKD